MASHSIALRLLVGRLAVCRLPGDAPIPGWVPERGEFVSVTRAAGELSVVCPEGCVPGGVQAETGWRVLLLVGRLDLSLVGVLAALLQQLAAGGVRILDL